jgi:hypothetical protein
LQNTANDFGMETTPEKCETISFLREDPVRCKVIVHDKCSQVKNYKQAYLVCEISYEIEKDIQQHIEKNFLKILEF